MASRLPPEYDFHRIFILSPAHCGGRRAQYILDNDAKFDLARKMRMPAGAPIGRVFTFLSGLYFRGKVTYARAFATPPQGVAGSYVITPDRGLIPTEVAIGVAELREMAACDVDPKNPRYREPLERHAKALAARKDIDQVVLLGSIATSKYVDILLKVFGDKLHFPEEFVGRGDMSRGGLMLRRVVERRELNYVPVKGAVRTGKRPPKLEKKKV
jgi:hypothetical protein